MFGPVYTMLFQQWDFCYKTKKATDFSVKNQNLLASHLRQQCVLSSSKGAVVALEFASAYRIKRLDQRLPGVLSAVGSNEVITGLTDL